MVGDVQRQRSVIGGDDDVLEAGAPLAADVDTGFDRVGMSRLQKRRVARHHVRVLVLFHADAVAGPVDEELAEAGIVDHPPGGLVDTLARRTDGAGRHACRL